jgi:filamentous hemeagglutinin outer membrane protein
MIIMKKLYALACFLICALIPLHAESYVLDYAAERQFSTISSVEYDISGEAGVLTFEGKYTKLLGFGGSGNCYLDQYVDGSWVRVATLNMLTTDWQTLTYTLDRRATKVKMYTETGATGYKNFRNVKVTRARYIEAQSINLDNFTYGAGADDVKTQSFILTYSNAANVLTATSDNAAFTTSISATTAEQAASSATVTVTYSPSSLARHDGTITISDGVVSFKQSVIGLCAPGNIAAGEATFHKLPVTWDAVSGAESYTIQMRNALNVVEAEETISTPSYMMTGLTPDAVYSVRICSNFSEGVSSGYASGIVSTSDYIPTPQDLAVGTVFEATPISVAWNAVDDVVTYSVRIYSSDGSLVSETGNITGTSASIDAGLDPTRSYEVRLRADYKGFSSEEISVIPRCVPTPKDITYEITGKTEFKVSWNPVGVELYNIVVVNSDGGESVEDASVADTSYLVSGLVPATGYTVKVRALTDDGATPYASVPARSWELLPPASLEALAGEEPFSMRLAWPAVEEADAYEVSLHDAGDTPVRDTVIAEGTDALLLDVVPGTYTVKVAPQWSGYTFGAVSAQAVVDKKTLSVHVGDTSRMYGQENPEQYVLEYSGWIGAHTSVAVAPEVVTEAVPSSPAGEYALNVSGGEDAWYTFSGLPGVLTVTKAPLHVSVADTSRYYHKPDPEFRLIYEGFLLEDDASVLQQEPVAASNATLESDFGVYDITLSGGVSDRYEFILSEEPAKLTISQAVTEVSAGPIRKVYGDAPFAIETNNIDTKLSCTIADGSVAMLDAEGRIVVKALGETTVTVSQAGSEHFTELPETQIQLIVGKAPLLISAIDTSRLYGSENPDFRIVYEGFVAGENERVLSSLPTVATDATVDSGIGAYEITVSGASADNYEIEYRPGTLTVQPLPSDLIIATVDTAVYGGSPVDLPAVSSLNTEGAYSYAVTDSSVAVVSDGKIDIRSAGATWVKVTQEGSGNYGTVSDSVALVVKKARLTVSVSDTIRLYGEENPLFEIRYEGFVRDDNATVLDELPQVRTSATVESDPGKYPVVLSGGSAANYELVYVEGAKLVVDKLSALIETDSIQVVYGSEPVALVSNNPDGRIHGVAADTAVAGVSDGLVVIRNAGKTRLSVYQDESAYYHASDTFVVELQVDKAMLTVSVSDTSRCYREDNPVFTFTYSGFVNGDDTTAVNVEPVAATEAGIDAKVGEYVVTASGAQSSNYDFTYEQGTLFVRPAVSVLEIATVDTLVYGQLSLPLPEVQKNNDEQEMTFKTLDAAVAVVKEGKIEITGAGTTSLVAVQELSENYLPGSDTIEIVVKKALLSVRAVDTERSYGEANPEGKLSYEGFVYGDDTTALSVKPVLCWEADSLSPVGVYAVWPEGAEADDYKFEYHAGELTVNPAQTVISITLPDTAIYGDEPRALDILSNNTESEIIYAISDPTIVEITDGRLNPKRAGSTMVIAMQTGSQNYTQGVSNFFTFVVKKAPLTISVADTSRSYGMENPAFTLSYEGFVNGDDETSLLSLPQVECAAVSISDVGEYDIVVGGAAAGNYEISYRPGTLSVVPAATTLSVGEVGLKYYGDDSFALSVTTNNPESEIDYFVEDTRVVKMADDRVVVVAPGTTHVLLKQEASTNYAASEAVSVPVTVSKRPLYVSVSDAARDYGKPNPEFEILYDGFVLGESDEDLTAKPVALCSADSLSLGSFPIVLSGGRSDNYEFVYSNGTLSIGSVNTELTVASIESKTYGDLPFALPSVTTNNNRGEITYTVADENVAVIADGRVHIRGTGETTLTVRQSATDSHTAAEVTIPLTVSKAVLTVTAENKECRQGDEMPGLTYVYKGFVTGEDETVLSAVPEISCEVSETVQAGTFLITVSGGEATNYDFSYKSGLLTVSTYVPTQLSVASIEGKTYGDLPFALPSVTTNNNRGEITYTVADEGIAVISEGRIYIKGVGKTSLIVRQAATETYSSAEVEVGFTVSKAVLTVTAENKICCQGEVLPELTLAYKGFAMGEDEASLDVLPGIVCGVSDASCAGTYEIIVSGGESDHYDFVYRPGTLTITELADISRATSDNIGLYYATGNLHISGTVSRIVISDIRGAEVKRIVRPQATESIAELPVGHYIIRVESADKKILRYRIVKE